MTYSFSRSAQLFERAQQIVPGGHHLSGRPLVDPYSTPMYFDWARGAHIRDVDGNTYVDWLMAFGPYLLGYARPEVDQAGEHQARQGRLLSLNHPLHVRFIETLLPLFPGAEMGAFFRTGSEATTAALRVARRATGRRRVARCGYHGWHDWCLPLEDFVPDGLDTQILEFSANEPTSLDALFERYPAQIAAVILAPEMVLPLSKQRIAHVQDSARKHGAVFIMDEVKTAFRAPQRSISAWLGIVPDLITLSKALGNGWPVAAVLGRRNVLEHASGMHFSATFHGDVSAMAAALTAVDLIEREGAAAHVEKLGNSLIAGFEELAREHALQLEAFAEPIAAMPFMRFTYPSATLNKRLSDTFYRVVLQHGVLLHPRHLWFPSLAHTALDVERTLEAAHAALKSVKTELSREP